MAEDIVDITKEVLNLVGRADINGTTASLIFIIKELKEINENLKRISSRITSDVI